MTLDEAMKILNVNKQITPVEMQTVHNISLILTGFPFFVEI